MTNLDSLSTLALSWLVCPALVVLVAAGLGLGMSRLVGLRLGALTLPTGFLAGMAVMGSLLFLSVRGTLVVAVTVALAIAGAALALAKGDGRGVVGGGSGWAWAAGLVAFAVGMAPLVGTGHAGILGYVLNNDSSVHVASVELLRDHGARAIPQDSSFAQVSGQFVTGYPLGSYAWPLVAGVLAGVDAFLTWSPLIAVAAAMTALAAFALARRLGAAGPVAAAGGVLVPSGYLPFSFLATASPKEVILGTGAITTVAVAMLALDHGLTARRALAPGTTLAGAIACFGIGSVSLIGPPLALAALIGLVQAQGRRLRAAVGLAAGAAATLLLAAPAVLASLRFSEVSARVVKDPNAVGNLLGAVPWLESFNVWLAGDYRWAHPDLAPLTWVGTALAAALAALGIFAALRRRDWAVPLLVLGAAVAAKYVEANYSTYFETKLYVVLGVALGMATVAGLIALIGHPRLRRVGLALGAVWILMVAASDTAVYRQVWTTPAARFQELSAIAERFDGQGPMLVSEREDYAKTLLRAVRPWSSWDVWTPDNGLRAGYPVPPPHTPDFDDYRWDFMQRFPLLLERRRPGGSLPPEGFRVVAETPHYRVWRRTGPLAKAHMSLGTDVTAGTASLNCDTAEAQQFLAATRGRPLRVALGESRLLSVPAWRWDFLPPALPGPTADFVYRRGGIGFTSAVVPPGRYVVWIQGGFGRGVRVEVGGRPVGAAADDLGLFDQWHRLGRVVVPAGGARPRIVGLDPPPWHAGMRRLDLTGPVAFEPTAARRRVVTVPPSRQRSLCGRNLDWVEAS